MNHRVSGRRRHTVRHSPQWTGERYIELELRPLAEPVPMAYHWAVYLAYLNGLARQADPAELADLAECTRRLADSLHLAASAASAAAESPIGS